MTKRGFTSVLALALAIATLAVLAPRAEAAIYVEIDGIDGDATHEDHRNWITVESAGANISREITMTTDKKTGANTGREVSGPSFDDFKIVKQLDTASPYLRQLAVEDPLGREVRIHFVSTGSPGQTYFEITLSDAVISSVSMTSGGDRPIEVITLNFTRIEWRYIPLEANNEAGSPVTKGYDLLLNTPF